MCPLRSFLLVSTISLALVPQSARPQQPAPELNPMPLERPAPLARIKATDPEKVMKAIADILRKFSYQIDRSQAASVDARRFDAPNRPNTESEYDRVIVWLERDFDKPLDYVNVFFLWGRYELIWGRERGIRRIVPRTEGDIPRLKAAIADLSQP